MCTALGLSDEQATGSCPREAPFLSQTYRQISLDLLDHSPVFPLKDSPDCVLGSHCLRPSSSWAHRQLLWVEPFWGVCPARRPPGSRFAGSSPLFCDPHPPPHALGQRWLDQRQWMPDSGWTEQVFSSRNWNGRGSNPSLHVALSEIKGPLGIHFPTM